MPYPPPPPTCDYQPFAFIIRSTLPLSTANIKVKNRGFIQNNKAYDDYTLHYSSHETVSDTRNSLTINNKITENVSKSGFGFTIPGVEIPLPGFIMNDWPTVNSGCKTCVQGEWPRLCDWKTRYYKKCQKIFGKKICVKVPYYIPTKCVDEIIFSIFNKNGMYYFDFKQTSMNYAFYIVPDFDINMDFRLESRVGISPSAIDMGTYILSFICDKLEIGMDIYITDLSVSYGNFGINIKNNKFRLFPKFDLCSGGKTLTSTVNSKGELSLWYAVYSYEINLYDLLKDNNLIAPGTPTELVTILKNTYEYITMGLLLCPFEQNPVRFVIQTRTLCSPFITTRISIPKIPQAYLDHPKIPTSSVMPDSVTRQINRELARFTDTTTKYGKIAIDSTTEYITNVVESIKIDIIRKRVILLT